MEKFTKIYMIIWACLAVLSFVCAFFCPLFIKIIGLTFGTLNILTILTVVIAYFQGLFYNVDEDVLQLQTEDKEIIEKETSEE